VLVENKAACICSVSRFGGILSTMTTPTRSTANLHTPAAELHRILERMKHPFAHGGAEEIALGVDDVHSVRVGHHPMTFTVVEGEVLVTCEGDLEDHVLYAGETFHTELRGHHVIAALRPSRVRVDEAAPERRAA
jgi:hypothetical protein